VVHFEVTADTSYCGVKAAGEIHRNAGSSFEITPIANISPSKNSLLKSASRSIAGYSCDVSFCEDVPVIDVKESLRPI
jgi:hypothetical protein